MLISNIPDSLRKRLLFTALLAGGITAGNALYSSHQTPSEAAALAQTLGAYYEGYRLTPYRDTGGIWTVCHGITGGIIPSKTYTADECKALEIKRYQQAEQEAKRLFTHWSSYNVYVQASLIDMIYNLGAGQVAGSTLLKLANQGDLTAACAEMPRWVWGITADGKQKLQGLVNRRQTTQELCAEWGRTGHFSEAVL